MAKSAFGYPSEFRSVLDGSEVSYISASIVAANRESQ